MFESMLESSVDKRKRQNPWAYLISISLQTILLGALVLVGLIHTEALPESMQLTFLSAPPPPPPPPPPPAAKPIRRIIRKRVSQMQKGKLRAPKAIPKEIAVIEEEDLPADVGGVAFGVPGGVPGGRIGGVMGGVLGGIPSAAPPPPPQKPIRVSSGVQSAKILRKTNPSYPPIARQARIQGVVRLEAIISKDGTIRNLRVIQGHPLLVQAAVQAVQQWRYAPTLLNDQPVEVVTYIDVIFKLG